MLVNSVGALVSFDPCTRSRKGESPIRATRSSFARGSCLRLTRGAFSRRRTTRIAHVPPVSPLAWTESLIPAVSRDKGSGGGTKSQSAGLARLFSLSGAGTERAERAKTRWTARSERGEREKEGEGNETRKKGTTRGERAKEREGRKSRINRRTWRTRDSSASRRGGERKEEGTGSKNKMEQPRLQSVGGGGERRQARGRMVRGWQKNCQMFY